MSLDDDSVWRADTERLASRMYLDKDLVLRDLETGIRLSEQQAKEILARAMISLGQRTDAFSPLSGSYVGVGLLFSPSKVYAVPSINGLAASSIRFEFTGEVERVALVEAPITPSIIRNVKKMMASAKSDDDRLNLICEHATLRVESIGARVTNRDTGYTILFRNVNTPYLRKVISGCVKVVNQDHRNQEWEHGFVLTCQSEVAEFMAAVGLGKEFLTVVEEVKEFEAVNRLRDIYEQAGGSITNYRDVTLVKEMLLSALGIASIPPSA